jgi:hypothetical protein
LCEGSEPCAIYEQDLFSERHDELCLYLVWAFGQCEFVTYGVREDSEGGAASTHAAELRSGGFKEFTVWSIYPAVLPVAEMVGEALDGVCGQADIVDIGYKCTAVKIAALPPQAHQRQG